MAEHFCGCCGNQLSTNAQWCGPCRKHVISGSAAASLAPWERTYFAQYDEDCPVPLKDFMTHAALVAHDSQGDIDDG